MISQGMKKLVLGIVIGFLVVLLMNAVGAADPVVIMNLGFEDGESGFSWMPMPTQIRPASLTTTEDKHLGEKSLKLEGAAAGYGAYLSTFTTSYGDIITIKFWAKSTNGGKLGFHGNFGISGYYTFPASEVWTEYTYNLDTTTSSYSSLQIILFGSSSGVVYYDDFLITKTAATPTPTGTATVTPTPTPSITGDYIVSYGIEGDWGTGATVNVTITNNTDTPVNGWTLAFSFPGDQTISNLWNGTFTQSGTLVSVKDIGYNATIPAGGGSVNFGFNLNYSGTNAKPLSFILNGTMCQAQ